MTAEFVECAACSFLPGAPDLCASCQQNRSAINAIRVEIEAERSNFRRTIDDQSNYTISLQRMIEALSAGRDIPPGTSHLRSLAARVAERQKEILSVCRDVIATCSQESFEESDLEDSLERLALLVKR